MLALTDMMPDIGHSCRHCPNCRAGWVSKGGLDGLGQRWSVRAVTEDDAGRLACRKCECDLSMYARCVICCAICDSDAISTRFERCFEEHLPIDQPQLNCQQSLINRPLLPLFGDTLPYVDEGIADTILAQLGPIAYGRLSQTSVEWRRSTQSVRPLRLWFNQQIAALRGTMTMPDCSCGPSFLRALPDDASRSECGLAGARLERGMSLEKVFVSISLPTKKHQQVLVLQSSPDTAAVLPPWGVLCTAQMGELYEVRAALPCPPYM